MLKRNLRRQALYVVLLSLLIVGRVAAQGIPQGAANSETSLGGVNIVSGMIISSSGQRLSRRVSVRLRTMTRGDQISTSDDSGNFIFRGVPPGDYVVVIDKEQEFEPFTQNVTVIQPRGMPPQTYYLSIRLILKGRPDSKTGVLNAEFANVPPKARAFYDKARELAQAGNHKGAVDQLKQAISEHPDFMLAFNELGVQHLQLGELEKADEALGRAMKLAPNSATPLLTHGILLTLMGKFNQAVNELQAALKQKDQSPNGHLYLGQALANLGRFNEAEQHLTRAIELGGDEMKDAHRFLGAIYIARGDRERGVAELETYLRLAPKAQDADKVRQMIRQNRRSQNHRTKTPTPAATTAFPQLSGAHPII